MKNEARKLKQEKIRAFDPNGIGRPNGNLFGLPFTVEESEVVIIPVPWDVTASFRRGAVDGPAAILEASYQIDLYDPDMPNAWQIGIAMLPIAQEIKRKNRSLRQKAAACVRHLEKGGSLNSPIFLSRQYEVNEEGKRLNGLVRGEAAELLHQGKLVGVLGGDHSVPQGLLEVLVQRSPGFSVLHIDAHFDLRHAYEGFTYSHASIMSNVSSIHGIDRFIHVGIRDYCVEEAEKVAKSIGRHIVFTDRSIKRKIFEGESLRSIVDGILRAIPQSPVYVSFDIDGLDPALCPNTGTPVPGGFSLEEVFYLLTLVVESGRRIIGFDLCEVAPASADSKDWAGDWNANVGMRVLYRLSTLAAKSCGKEPKS